MQEDQLEYIQPIDAGIDERASLYKLPSTMSFEVGEFDGRPITIDDVQYVIIVELDMELDEFTAGELGTDRYLETAVAVSNESGDAGPPIMIKEDETLEDVKQQFEETYL